MLGIFDHAAIYLARAYHGIMRKQLDKYPDGFAPDAYKADTVVFAARLSLVIFVIAHARMLDDVAPSSPFVCTSGSAAAS